MLCETDDIGTGNNAYTASDGVTLTGTNLSIETSFALPQGCSTGEISEWDGAKWICATDDLGSSTGAGDISAVLAADGLLGGADSGSVSLSVDFSSNGSSSKVSRADHNHLGQTWEDFSNSAQPLSIKGTFKQSAALVLANSAWDGLTISDAANKGINVEGADSIGVYVDYAEDGGVRVAGTGFNGVQVDSAGQYGGSFQGNDAGIYALGANRAADIILGANGSATDDDNGVISADPSQLGSDMYIEANDLIVVNVDTNNTGDGGFYVQHSNGNGIYMLEPGGNYIDTTTGAYLSNGGAWTNASDKNLKTRFEPLDTYSILNKVVDLPLTSWQYKRDSSATHIGPMAQDFHAAFGLGSDDKSIATVDANGVAFAAIQGLYALIEAKDEQIKALEVRLSALEN